MDFLKSTSGNRSSFPFRHAKELGFVLLAVVAVLIAVLAMTSRENGAGLTPVPAASPPESSRAAAPNVDVIGDSYVVGSDQGGYGAANWTKIVGSRFYAESHPIDMNVIGHPGAGYIVRGTEKVNFAEAATASLRSTADLVLVFGSRNDGKQDPAAMAAAATALYATIHERAPRAKLIVVGPAWVDERVPDFITSDSKAISAAAATAGIQFVDPLSDGWFFGINAKLIGADGVHPTDAGHQYLAEKMFELISKTLATIATP
jgi:lysophospholipase L1-like esterase